MSSLSLSIETPENMHLRKFRKTYGLELLPTSHAEISLGDLIWRPSYGRANLVRRSLPSHVYNIFLKLKKITESEWRKAMRFFESEETQPAKLAESRISTDRSFVTSFSHEILDLFKNDLSVEREVDFSFGRLEVQVMPKIWRLKIQQLLEGISAKQWEKLFKRPRPIHMITELYYGNITILADRKLTLELEASLARHFEQALHKYTEGNTQVYEFSHNQVPFAMRIEALEGFRA